LNREDFPAPREGAIVTHFLVVGDQDASREWYRDVFGAKVVRERDPVILRFENSWLKRPATRDARARSSI
jgi:hypothetical protein